MSKIHDDYLQNVTSRKLTMFSFKFWPGDLVFIPSDPVLNLT